MEDPKSFPATEITPDLENGIQVRANGATIPAFQEAYPKESSLDFEVSP